MDEQSVEEQAAPRTTRCKFRCTSIEKSVPWNNPSRFLFKATFSIVSDGSEENKRFFEYTPSGQLTVGTYKEDVFTPGKCYYLDITEAPE